MKRLAGNEQGGAVSDTYEQKKRYGERGKEEGERKKGEGKKAERNWDETAATGLYALPVYVRAVSCLLGGVRMYLHKQLRYSAGRVLGASPPLL